MEVVIIIALIGMIPGAIAHHKGHSFWTWWIFGALLFIVALPMAIVLKPVGEDTERAGSGLTDLRVKPFTVVLIVVLVVAAGWYFLGGAHDAMMQEESRQFVRDIENTVAADAVRQYNIAARNGSPIDVRVQAGIVAAAYLQAENEAEYARWKQIEKNNCDYAQRAMMEQFTRTTQPEPAYTSEYSSPEPSKPVKWQDSKGYWHFADEDPSLDDPNKVSGTGIYKWQDDQGNWHFSDKGIDN